MPTLDLPRPYRQRLLDVLATRLATDPDGPFLDFEGTEVTARQIEAGRVALTRHLKRGGKVWIRVFPDKPVTKKPAETRMGKGKGAPELWVAVVKRGRVMFEIEGVSEELAREAIRLAGHKFPIETRFVKRA